MQTSKPKIISVNRLCKGCNTLIPNVKYRPYCYKCYNKIHKPKGVCLIDLSILSNEPR